MTKDELMDIVIDAGLSKEYNESMRKVSSKLAREIITTAYEDMSPEKLEELKKYAQEVFPKNVKAEKFAIDVS
tara:strand:+ start:665 stop:883 length:219 start_codon:yes stop_codon:yes gene_type:complete